MYLNENEMDSPFPIKYIVTHDVNVGDVDDITPEDVVTAMNDSKAYLEGEGVEEVKFRTSYDDYVILEAYGWRMEDENEAVYRNISRNIGSSFQNHQQELEYFHLKAEREKKGLPL